MNYLKLGLLLIFIGLISGCSIFNEESENERIKMTKIEYPGLENDEYGKLIWMGNKQLVFKKQNVLQFYNSDYKLKRKIDLSDRIIDIKNSKSGGFFVVYEREDKQYIKVFDQQGDELFEKGPFISLREVVEVDDYFILRHPTEIDLYTGKQSLHAKIVNQSGEVVWNYEQANKRYLNIMMQDEDNYLYYYRKEEPIDDPTNEFYIQKIEAGVPSWNKGPYMHMGNIIELDESGYVFKYTDEHADDYVVKLNENGEVLWSKGPYNNVTYLSRTNEGFIYNVSNEDRESSDMIQVDEDGSKIWEVEQSDTIIENLVQLEDGGFVSLFSNRHIKRFNKDGELLWEYPVNTWDFEFFAMNNNVVINTRLTSGGFKVKMLNQQGHEVWEKGPYVDVQSLKVFEETDEVFYLGFSEAEGANAYILDSDGNNIYMNTLKSIVLGYYNKFYTIDDQNRIEIITIKEQD